MKRNMKITFFALILFVGVMIFSFKAQMAFVPENRLYDTTAVSEEKDGASKKLYLNNCARCHGGDGKSQTELGQLYDATDLTDKSVKKKSSARLASIIRNGKDSMPAFKNKLSSKEISALVNYIRALK